MKKKLLNPLSSQELDGPDLVEISTKDKIKNLAKEYSEKLKTAIETRVTEMAEDDFSHYLIYRVLGIDFEEGRLIDLYQNKGRFLYKYAGSFLEAATKLCFLDAYPDSSTARITNSLGVRPAKFEIDCLVGNDALEIKWKDATTDGDHITKEHTRIQVIAAAGYIPIRVMFYYPQRKQAMKIQQALQTMYAGIGGQYYFGDDAWKYVHQKTSINLQELLEEIAVEREQEKKQ